MCPGCLHQPAHKAPSACAHVFTCLCAPGWSRQLNRVFLKNASCPILLCFQARLAGLGIPVMLHVHLQHCGMRSDDAHMIQSLNISWSHTRSRENTHDWNILADQTQAISGWRRGNNRRDEQQRRYKRQSKYRNHFVERSHAGVQDPRRGIDSRYWRTRPPATLSQVD